MRSAYNVSVSLFLVAAGPLFWLACGGSAPPKTAADESASSDDSGSAAAADSSNAETPAPAGSAAAPGDTPAASPEASAASAPAEAPPPAQTFGSTDCGACVDKACAKPAAACRKNSDCQAMVNGIHSCSGAPRTCIGGATVPSSGKPKKLAGAYEKCAKKAVGAACKARCQ